jgi:hypothetical protein
MDYDLLLLAVPAVLLAADWCRAGEGNDGGAADRWLTRAWVGLFAAMTLGPAVASSTRVHPVVPALAMTAALSIHRCLRRRQKADNIRPPECEPAALAA